jgi:Protein of unknown function (DUF4030)
MEDKLKYPKNAHMHFNEKHKKNVLGAIKDLPEKNQRKGSKIIMKRWGYSTLAAAALFLLLIGSTHISLGMAKVAAKIPYFNLFIEQTEYKYALYDVIGDVMHENKYEFNTLDVSIPDREIQIEVLGTKEEVKAMKDEVIVRVNNELVAQNFGKYDIEVKRGELRQPMEPTPEENEYMRKSMELEGKVQDLLVKNNYQPAFPIEVRINSMENFIYIALPKTEKRVDELKEQLKLLTKEYGEFRYRITSIDMAAREQELRWGKSGVLDVLFGGLDENKAFKVTGLSYSFHPLPLQIKVKISLKSTDPEAKQLAEEIENEITDFIQTHEMATEVRNDPYELIILGKDKKKIN